MTPIDPGPHVSAIITLAEEIARLSPDCADKAFKIIEFARELGDCQPDRGSIQEAIESEMLEDEISDTRTRSMTSAVLAAMKPAPEEEPL
jgi:hypothetical protein